MIMMSSSLEASMYTGEYNQNVWLDCPFLCSFRVLCQHESQQAWQGSFDSAAGFGLQDIFFFMAAI